MERNKLFVPHNPNSMAAHRAFSIAIGVKRDLLCEVFGERNVLEMEQDAANDRPAYLNRFGANVHYRTTGGAHDDPVMSFEVVGHHMGEAAETVKALFDAARGAVVTQ